MNTDVIVFIFKTLNLAVFLGIACYLVLTHLVPMIRERMRKKQDQQNHKRAHEDGLAKEIEVILSRIVQQKTQAQELMTKAQEWQASVAQEQVARNAEHIHCKALMAEYLVLAQKGIHQEHLIKTTMPEVVNSLEYSAKRYYQDEAHVSRALDRIFELLEKSMQ